MSVQKLVDETIKNNYLPFNKWQEDLRDYNKINKIRNLLDVLSGHNIVGMLKDVLKPAEKTEIAEDYVDALKKIAIFYNLCTNKSTNLKTNICNSLKDSMLSLKKAKDCNFKISKTKWHSKHTKDVKELKKNRKLSDDLVFSIQNHLEGISSAAANRMIIKRKGTKKELVNCRYLNVSFSDAYISFISIPGNNQISKSCFRSYMGKEFKKPHNNSDLCDHCLYGKVIKNQIIRQINENSCEYTNIDSDQFDFENLKNHFKIDIDKIKENQGLQVENTCKTLNQSISHDIVSFEQIKLHYADSQKQRLAYNFDRSDKESLKTSILIELDFKQKVIIGMGPDQPNKDFYLQQTRTLLGIGIYYLDPLDNSIKTIYVDVISNMSTTGICVVECLKLLRKNEFFKAISKNRWTVWCDTGTHFRNSTIAHYFFEELANEQIPIVVNLNFFVEKDIVDTINKGNEDSNKYRVNVLGLEPLCIIALCFPEDHIEKVGFQKLTITDITMYYNLQNVLVDDKENNNKIFKIQSTIYSGLSVLKEVFVSNNSVDATVEIAKEKIVTDPLHSIIELTKRNNFLKILNRAPLIGLVSRETFTEKPIVCTNKCVNCKAKVAYTIAELEEKPTKIGQARIRKELGAHSHSKTRTVGSKNKRRQASTEEQRAELILHLKFKHKESLN